jgi:hypothetical protein
MFKESTNPEETRLSIWNWRGWLVGVALGALTNRSFAFTAVSLILVLRIAEQGLFSRQRISPMNMWLWLENDNGIIIGALICSLLLLALRS